MVLPNEVLPSEEDNKNINQREIESAERMKGLGIIIFDQMILMFKKLKEENKTLDEAIFQFQKAKDLLLLGNNSQNLNSMIPSE